jgi:hypothetical protein
MSMCEAKKQGVNGNPPSKAKSKRAKKRKKTALVVCRDRSQFWTTQKQFWQWVREGVVTKTGEQPLKGEFLREHEQFLVVLKNTVLNMMHRNHTSEVLKSRRIGIGP